MTQEGMFAIAGMIGIIFLVGIVHSYKNRYGNSDLVDVVRFDDILITTSSIYHSGGKSRAGGYRSLQLFGVYENDEKFLFYSRKAKRNSLFAIRKRDGKILNQWPI